MARLSFSEGFNCSFTTPRGNLHFRPRFTPVFILRPPLIPHMNSLFLRSAVAAFANFNCSDLIKLAAIFVSTLSAFVRPQRKHSRHSKTGFTLNENISYNSMGRGDKPC